MVNVLLFTSLTRRSSLSHGFMGDGTESYKNAIEKQNNAIRNKALLMRSYSKFVSTTSGRLGKGRYNEKHVPENSQPLQLLLFYSTSCIKSII